MPQSKRRRDPFADYVEWSNNRYNPGYYLGGNIPPYLRKSRLGPRASRRMGVLLAMNAVIAVGILLVSLPWREGGFDSSPIVSALAIVLTGSAALAMFRSARRKEARRDEARDDRPPE